ncbi:MAG: class I SAM-dependent methyltransferase [Rhodospirillales bacterium]|nr:class I SAM-dependent methyltransferase [Rhodospirillales bacterium]
MSSSLTAASNEYANLGPEDLARLADEFTWFHAIDCGNFQTSGRFKPGTPQNRTLYGAFDLIRQMDLRGQNCLDIGTSDGLLAFGMKTLGAETVIASDTYRLKSFDLACTAIGAAIDYRPRLQIKDLLATFQPASFDLIACAGIIYHMLNPLSALLVGRQLVKEGGYFLVETAYAPGAVWLWTKRWAHSSTIAAKIARALARLAPKNEPAAMVFNPVAEIDSEMYTYWLPTRAALEGMMRMASFEVVATRTINRLRRITVLGRAVKPVEVNQRSALLQKMHDIDFCDHEFRLKQLFSESRAASSITMQPVEIYEDLSPAKWSGSYPHHPRTLSNPKGRTRWSTADGNV